MNSGHLLKIVSHLNVFFQNTCIPTHFEFYQEASKFFTILFLENNQSCSANLINFNNLIEYFYKMLIRTTILKKS
jgi:hypothetical protein